VLASFNTNGLRKYGQIIVKNVRAVFEARE
jgi:hypothetical protein